MVAVSIGDLAGNLRKWKKSVCRGKKIKANCRIKQGLKERMKSWVGFCVLFYLLGISFTLEFPWCSYMRQKVYLSLN